MSYNLDEHLGDNHYNCPVVAYYPEVIAANMPAVRQIDFIHDYVGIDHRKVFPKKLTGICSSISRISPPARFATRATRHTMPTTHTWRTFAKRAKR